MNKSFSDFVINPLSVHFTSPIPGERGTRGLFTTACGARSAELADTDTHNNSDASRGACAASERRQPRPTQPLPPIHSTFSILHSSSPESAGRAVSLQPIAERLRRGAVGRERPQEPRDEPRSARSHGSATAKANTQPLPSIHFTFSISNPRIYSEQNPTLACRNRIETKSFLTCFPTS